MKLHLVEEASTHFDNNRNVWAGVGLLLSMFIAVSYYVGTAMCLGAIYAVYKLPSYWSIAYLIIFTTLTFGPAEPIPNMRSSKIYKSVALYFEAKVYSEEPRHVMAQHPKPCLILVCPHGIISLGSWCVGSLFYARPAVTACADVILRLPVIRQLYAPFGMLSSGREAMLAALQQKRSDEWVPKKTDDSPIRDVCLYSGGLAELFANSHDTENLYFKHRLGCIRLALLSGADVRICYIFGQSHMFKHLVGKYTKALSRLLRVSICLFYGRYFCLFLPFKTRVSVVYSKVVRLPAEYASQPDKLTDDIVRQQHDRVEESIRALYNEYKSLHPDYMNKPLIIL